MRPAMLGEGTLNIHRAFYRFLNSSKRNEEAVPRVVDLFPAVASKQHAERLIVPPQHILPGLVPDCFHQGGRFDHVGKHEGFVLHPPSDSRSSGFSAEEFRGPLRVRHSAQMLEGRPRGFQFHRSVLHIPVGAASFAQQHPGFRRLVGGVDFLPQLHAALEVLSGQARLTRGQVGGGPRIGGGGFERRRSIRAGDLFQLRRSCLSRRAIAGSERDVDESREEPGSTEAIARLVGKCGVDQCQGGIVFSLSQAER